MDITDPFYIHHSDHPGLHLVSKPLDGDNYSTWSRAMTISLSAKNKLGFMDGSIEAPPETDAKYSLWKRCNDMVLSWMVSSIGNILMSSVLYTNSPAEIWEDLKERFYHISNQKRDHRTPTTPTVHIGILYQTQRTLGRSSILQHNFSLHMWDDESGQ
ncbi:hypothetical protein ACFX2A_048208 [Malus domestica]